MKRILIALVTAVLVGSLAYSWYSINGNSALANESDTQAVDTSRTDMGEDVTSGQDLADSQEGIPTSQTTEPEVDGVHNASVSPSYEQQNEEVLVSPQSESPEAQSYWIRETRYSELIGEYETWQLRRMEPQ